MTRSQKSPLVIPAKAGIHLDLRAPKAKWIARCARPFGASLRLFCALCACPAFAGMTMLLAACGKAPNTAPTANTGAAPVSAYVAIARGKIDVEGGIVRVAATRDGVISAMQGDIGDAVKAGDVLVALDPKPAQIALDAAHAELAAANAQASLLRAKLPALRQRAARVVEASQAGATSGQSADDANQALTELRAEVSVADANVETARQKTKQAEYEVEARQLRAPVAGRIVARVAQIGAAVSTQAGGDLVEILPDKPRIVRAELNEGFVAKVKVGQTAEVSSDVDGKSYAAHVSRIGDVFGPSKLTESTQDATDTRDVECILQLDNAGELRIGQRVQVRFLPQGK